MIRVMIVEDDPMVMDITCKYVESIEGFEICAKAASGNQALEILSKLDVDFIVLDIYMPVMNGIELLTNLRLNAISIDVLFLTAENNVSIINDALKLGAFDYLIKPFSYERFKTALENYAKRYSLLHGSGQATQEQLDDLLRSGTNRELRNIPKGIHPKTLENLRYYIQSAPQRTFSQGELSRQLGLSKVTVRRYMEYLVSINEVLLKIEYGSVGRPTYTYQKLI